MDVVVKGSILAKQVIEGAAVLVVLYGAAEAFCRLAADIVRSPVSPSSADIGQLGAIAGIGTFLNYFLEDDLGKAGGPEES